MSDNQILHECASGIYRMGGNCVEILELQDSCDHRCLIGEILLLTLSTGIYAHLGERNKTSD